MYLRKIFAVGISFATSCRPFDTNLYQSAYTRTVVDKNEFSSPSPSSSRLYDRRVSSTRLRLFHPLSEKSDRKRIGRQNGSPNGASPHGIPEEELHFLRNGFGLETSPPPFPHFIELSRPAKKVSKLVIRHLEDEDIKNIMPEVIREFGALAPPPSATSSQPGDELATRIENFLFSLTVLIGLTQRVVRREKGYSPNNAARPDHNVICLCEQIPRDESDEEKGQPFSEQIVGIAELSWQPPNPNSNAPPFVLPYFMKSLISQFGPSRDGTASKEPKGYISNVLVWKTRRGRGYSRVLMAGKQPVSRFLSKLASLY